MATQMIDNKYNSLYNVQFPNAISIPMELYNNSNYNKLRICKLLLISDLLGVSEILTNNKILQTRINLLTNNIKTNMLNEFTSNRQSLIFSYLFKKISTRENITFQIEKSCYNKAISVSKKNNIKCDWDNLNFTNIYNNVCYKVATNIDPNSIVNSDYILKKILNCEIDLSNIAFMTSRLMCPKKYVEFDEKIYKRSNLEIKIKFSELYQCKKCKKNQTTTERRYARSLDEGVDLTITCHFCGNRWNA